MSGSGTESMVESVDESDWDGSPRARGNFLGGYPSGSKTPG
jgi:hypothetical protein